jgi:hypothetical protein
MPEQTLRLEPDHQEIVQGPARLLDAHGNEVGRTEGVDGPLYAWDERIRIGMLVEITGYTLKGRGYGNRDTSRVRWTIPAGGRVKVMVLGRSYRFSGKLQGDEYGRWLVPTEAHPVWMVQPLKGNRYMRPLAVYQDQIVLLPQESIEAVWEEAVPWQNKTFPLSTVKSIAAHLLKEAEELVAEPEDEKEVVDILMLLGHWLHKMRERVRVVPAMRAKLQVNMARTWGEVNEEGFVEHIREEKK